MAATLTIENLSESMPRIAVYQKSFQRPSLGLVAWRIAAPPREGLCQIEVPSTYQVHVSWGDPENPDRGCRTAPITIDTFSASFNVIPTPTDDRRQTVPTLMRVFDDVNPNEIDINNVSGQWVWAHVTKDSSDVYMPEILTPGMTFMVDVRPTYYLAVVNEFMQVGDRLVEAEHSNAGTPIMPGQRAIVSGSRLAGFGLDVR